MAEIERFAIHDLRRKSFFLMWNIDDVDARADGILGIVRHWNPWRVYALHSYVMELGIFSMSTRRKVQLAIRVVGVFMSPGP